jgi:hypothetical protein
MKESKNDTTSGQFLLTGVFLIFLTLKLCGVIDWSWWWVTSPLWIPFIIALLLGLGVIIWFNAMRR